MRADPLPSLGDTRPRTQSALTWAALALGMVSAYTITALPVFAPRAQEHFGLGEAGLGLLLSCAGIGSLLALPLAGPGTALLGARRFLQACLLAAGAGMILCGVGRSVWLFEVGLAVAGGAGTVVAVALPAWLMLLYPALRRRMVTLTLLILVAPGMLFPLLAQWLLAASTEGGPLSFAAVLHLPFVLLGAALAAGQLVLGLGAKQADVQQPATGVREPFRARDLLSLPALLVIACATLHAGADNSLYQWMPKFLESRFDQLPIAPGVVMSLYAAAYVLSRGTLAALPEGVGQRLMLVAVGPVGGGMLIAVIWLGGPLAVGLVYPLAGLLVALEYPALISDIRASSTTHFSTVYAAALWGSSLMTVVAINAIGQIGERTGDLRVGLTVAACGFVAFGLIALLAGLGRRQASGPDGDVRAH